MIMPTKMSFIAILVTCMLTHESMASSTILRFASPLQALTIWDASAKENMQPPRSRFLPKYKAGLKAEADARKAFQGKRKQAMARLESQGGDWADKAIALERRLQREEDRLAERAFNQATKALEEQEAKKKEVSKSVSSSDPNQYQFVGVVNRGSTDKVISWYARKKPAHSKWSLRLVHVNRDAIIKDLFNRGKVDVVARYKNTGQADEQTQQRIVTTEYAVKERSWRTLWNFSPNHFFTDSSGMYWRERRLPPGTYTDGNMVYETSYRYRDGRNGMRRVSRLEQFLTSKGTDPSLKDKVAKQMQTGAPDIVLEE